MHESLHWSWHCCPTKLECGGILNLDAVDIFTVDISRAFWVDFLKKRSYLHLAQCLCSAGRGTNSNTVATNGFCLLSTSSNALNEPSLSGPTLTPRIPRVLFCSRSRLTSDTGRTSKVPLSRPRPNLRSLRCRRAPSLPTPTGARRPRRPPCTGPWNRR